MTPVTPAEWLLARYDQIQRAKHGPPGPSPRSVPGDNFKRPIFEILDDHSEDCLFDEDSGLCFRWSGEATWPHAQPGDEIDDDEFPWDTPGKETMPCAA